MYEAYAPIYDRIGQGAWSMHMAAWTLDWLQARNVVVHAVADFGCGTGAAAQVFRANGLSVVGIDCSDAMLQIARQQLRDTQWISADVRSVQLPEPVELAVSFYDTLNYLVRYDDLLAAWRALAQALVPGGYAVADINTSHTYETEWNGQDTIIADTDEVFVLNRLHYDHLQRLGTGRIVWFARNGFDPAQAWQRQEEVHQQRAHTDPEIQAAIAAAGLTLIERHTPTGVEPDEQAPRVIYIAQKQG